MYFDSCNSNDRKQEVNNNYKCVHIKAYKKEHGLESYEIVHGCFVSCISKKSLKLKAQDCMCKVELCKARFERVHGCLYCAHFGCYAEGHIHQHAKETGHFLAIDINFGHVYCFKCQDYRYDSEFEEIAVRHRKIAARQRPDDSMYKYVPKLKDVKCFKKLHPSKVVLNGLRGILNMGKTCYMNCILQSLAHAPVIRDYFLSDKHKCSFQGETLTPEETLSESDNLTPVCFSCEMGKIVQELYSGKKDAYIPDKFLYLIWIHIKSLEGYKEHDAHEFLLEFLNVLHKHCEGTNDQIDHHGNCIMDKIFTGFSQSELTCLQCKFVSTNVVSFTDISLNLDSHSITLNGNAVDKSDPPMPKLIDCLEKFTQTEYLGESSQRTCDRCQRKQESSMQTKLKKLPIIIIFHLNRFAHGCNNEPIEFPEHLDMTPYMSGYNVPGDATNQESSSRNGFNKALSNKFYLFAVVKYVGDGVNGHYTSYVRFKKKNWFCCDDVNTTKTDFKEVKKFPPYLLFYHKEFLEYDVENVIEDKSTSNKVSQFKNILTTSQSTTDPEV